MFFFRKKRNPSKVEAESKIEQPINALEHANDLIAIEFRVWYSTEVKRYEVTNKSQRAHFAEFFQGYLQNGHTQVGNPNAELHDVARWSITFLFKDDLHYTLEGGGLTYTLRFFLTQVLPICSNAHQKSNDSLVFAPPNPEFINFKEALYKEIFKTPSSKPLDTLVSVTYHSRNYLSNQATTRHYIATEHPERTAGIVDFLKHYPPEHLPNDAFSEMDVHDANNWSFYFNFQDKAEDFVIHGYGSTLASEPLFSKLLRLLPEVLTEEERKERALRESIRNSFLGIK